MIKILSDWGTLDTWIVITATLAAMACALPGNFLLLRRQSMMGDAISHTVLLGIVGAFLFSHSLKMAGWVSAEAYESTRHAVMFVGAMVIGLLAALLTEWIQKFGRVESSAALGVVFTTMFAAGLLLIRVAADSVHIDPDCVLYGTIETAVMDTNVNRQLPQFVVTAFQKFGLIDIGDDGSIPRAALVNGGVLLINGLLVVLLFKELRIATFDSAMATSLGINASVLHYGLMAVTAGTLVSAFESVGSILVIAMLIVPAATAHLLTDRLKTMILLSLMIAAASALLGHILALLVPPVLLVPLGFETLKNVSASTAGMMAVASGLLFSLAALFGPRHGVLSKLWHRTLLGLRIASEDILGLLVRLEEASAEWRVASGESSVEDQMQWDYADARTKLADSSPREHQPTRINRIPGVSVLYTKLAVARLKWTGKITAEAAGFRLTESGRRDAEKLVRAHRLWESYMDRHFTLPEDHLHETAARVEHYIDPNLQKELAAELDQPNQDPHGRYIPDGK